MTQTFEFLINHVGVCDVMHGESVAALGETASFADDGDLSGRELTDFS